MLTVLGSIQLNVHGASGRKFSNLDDPCKLEFFLDSLLPTLLQNITISIIHKICK